MTIWLQALKQTFHIAYVANRSYISLLTIKHLLVRDARVRSLAKNEAGQHSLVWLFDVEKRETRVQPIQAGKAIDRDMSIKRLAAIS